MTVAAIDRLVHHAMIIEIEANAESFRKKQAMNRNKHLAEQVTMPKSANTVRNQNVPARSARRK
jgi:hypothetical protein